MPDLGARAAELRAAGIGAKRIAAQLGIPYRRTQELLRGVPVPSSLTRVRAKDELREVAIALRRSGRTYPEIREELGVSKGSLSLWLRELEFPTEEQRTALRAGTPGESADEALLTGSELARDLRAEGWLLREIAEELGISTKTAFVWCKGVPVPARAVHGRSPAEVRAMQRADWDQKLREREAERQRVMSLARARVGGLSDRELNLVAVTAYWCEGQKSKPWALRERLVFINSDPDLIRISLEWLRRQAVPLSQCRLNLSIHESADVDAATRYWSGVVGCPVEDFAKPSLKRHNPKTVRKNVGVTYVGCLVISTRQSRVLYQKLAGFWQGISEGVVVDHAANSASQAD